MGDVAPGNRFRSFSPVFPVRDLRRALAHYASLGFDVQPYADGDGYGFAGRDEVSLHLSLDEGHACVRTCRRGTRSRWTR